MFLKAGDMELVTALGRQQHIDFILFAVCVRDSTLAEGTLVNARFIL